MAEQDVYDIPRIPWAVRRFGFTHYVTNIPRCLVGLAIGAFFGAAIYALLLPFIEGILPVPERPFFGARKFADAIIVLLVGMGLTATLPWLLLHYLGLRGPVSAALLGPILLHATGLKTIFAPFLGTLVCALVGLIVWRFAYRRYEFKIDADVFA